MKMPVFVEGVSVPPGRMEGKGRTGCVAVEATDRLAAPFEVGAVADPAAVSKTGGRRIT